jgi:hypothetical protein
VRTNNDIARRYLDTVARSTGATAAAPPAAAPGGNTAPPAAGPPASAGAQTFPLSDPKPGQEPQAH